MHAEQKVCEYTLQNQTLLSCFSELNDEQSLLDGSFLNWGYSWQLSHYERIYFMHLAQCLANSMVNKYQYFSPSFSPLIFLHLFLLKVFLEMMLEILRGGNVIKKIVFSAKQIQERIGNNIYRVIILLTLYKSNIFSMLLESFKDRIYIFRNF